jgi:hypothetical protein
MEPWRSIAVGALIFLGVGALTGRLFVGLAAMRTRARPRNSYALVSAGLVFLACLAAGLTWFIVEPKLPVLVAAFVGSIIFAGMDWVSFGMEKRRGEWFADLAAKMRRKGQ